MCECARGACANLHATRFLQLATCNSQDTPPTGIHSTMAFLSTDMCESLTNETLEKLNGFNIWTVNELCSADIVEIKRSTGIKYHILKDIIDKMKHRYTTPYYGLDLVLEKAVRECKMCPTGLPELTQALDGGFQTQEIIEFCGDSETGKTEMCYLLCGEILSHFSDYRILYVASNSDFDHEKITKYTRLKAGNRQLSDDDVFDALARVEIARPTKMADFVHLLNTFAHGDRKNHTKCIIVDSLSFIIQDDILDIKTADLSDGDQMEKFSALLNKNRALILQSDSGATDEIIKRDFVEMYLHEVMRLLIQISLSKNAIVVVTNADSHLSYNKSWTNAIDHRIQFTKMSEHSRYSIANPKSTVCRATILKTVHNITRIGHSIPFAISDEGLFAVRLATPHAEAEQSLSSADSAATS